ncbi:hypothetical protein PhCBS80983_g04505 [Powellomyces hirtus]|uniref:Protein kinase domain-containing protein n=1 Tax=Powellomyces hirtus TaxID=109895 RepID=A0A507DXP3_9FUNG|nr:hypothetical protein PhCBS80983_g04505 [Powellomyces hirtus]
MFEYAKSALSGALGPKGPALPFSIGEPVHFGPIWTIHDGLKKDDRTPVSVFVFDLARHRDKLPLARNALKKCRTIRHPDMLRVLEGVETDTKIIIGTEPVTPLSTQTPLKSLNPNLIAWGLYKLAMALKFLNADCQMIHGNVRVDSIYTTKAGELGGLDLLGNMEKEDNPVLLAYGGHLPDSNRYQPPEIRRSGWNVCRTNQPHSVDSWGVGCLIHEIFNGTFSRPEDLGARDNIPPELFPAYKSFLSPDPNSRMTMVDFVDKGLWKKGYFDRDFISVTLSLEQIAIKDAYEKEQFMNKINASLESFPTEFCKYKILPELIKALEFGGAGSKALAPILKLGGKLNQQEFDSLVVPIVVKLFASTDRAIRVSLCEGLPGLIDHLNAKIVTEKIFPNLALGFLDSSAVIREHTLKSILVIVTKLSEKIINNELLRYLAKLQQDEEPGIRTNTTICLGKISKHLNDATKKRVLVPAFLRSFNDSFPPSRTAGLAALAATIDIYEGADCTQRIIPALAQLLLDPEKTVRKQAFSNMDLFVRKVEKLADIMPDTGIKAVPMEPDRSGQQPGAGANGEGWAGWALSAVSTKLTSGLTTSGSSGNLQAHAEGAPSSSSSTLKNPAMGAVPLLPSAAPMNPAYNPNPINATPKLSMVSAAMAPMVPVTPSNGWDAGGDGWGWDTEPDMTPAPKTNPTPMSLPSRSSHPFGMPSNPPFTNTTTTTHNTTTNWATFPPPAAAPHPPLSSATPVLQPTKAWGDDTWDADGWDAEPPLPKPTTSPISTSPAAPSAEDKERRRVRLQEQRDARQKGKLGARRI